MASQPVASSGRSIPEPKGIFDPVARALDIIGDRWTLVLVRQLLPGPRGFQELRQRTGIAPRVLSARLRQLQQDGFVTTVADGPRSQYAVTERARALEPVIHELATWWVHNGIQELEIDIGRFTETSPQSIFESLPVLLIEDAARDAQVVFEIRLTGEGGGVWTVTCRRCSEIGHTGDDCPTAKRCYFCGEPDHLAAECPNSVCFRCGRGGHLTRSCPNPRRSYQFHANDDNRGNVFGDGAPQCPDCHCHVKCSETKVITF